LFDEPREKIVPSSIFRKPIDEKLRKREIVREGASTQRRGSRNHHKKQMLFWVEDNATVGLK